jgi:hypothetical protein
LRNIAFREQRTLTKACGKRAGLCVIEVCSSLFIFITWDMTQVLIARLPQAKRWWQAVRQATTLSLSTN